LPHFIISSFTTGAAVVIGISQACSVPQCHIWVQRGAHRTYICRPCVNSLQAQNLCREAATQAVGVKPADCYRAGLSSQVKLLLGFHVPRHSSCLQTARYLAAHIRETVPLELGLGLAWLAVLLTMKHLGKTRR
jgi:hypothetical protein